MQKETEKAVREAEQEGAEEEKESEGSDEGQGEYEDSDYEESDEMNELMYYREVKVPSRVTSCPSQFQGLLVHTQTHSERFENVTKHKAFGLLPLGLHPLISYQLQQMEQYGITEIFVLVEKKFANKFEIWIKEHY